MTAIICNFHCKINSIIADILNDLFFCKFHCCILLLCFCSVILVEYAPIYFCTDTWNHSFTGILPTNSEIWTKSLNNCTIITGRIPRNPKIILFQVTADHIRIPVYIAVDTKLVPCCLYNFPERICQLMNALCSKSSLIVIFQVKPYRILQFSSIQNRHNLSGFALNFCDCHCIRVFINSYRNLILCGTLIVGFEIPIYNIASFRDPDHCKIHSIISNFFPVNLSLPCRYVNSS